MDKSKLFDVGPLLEEVAGDNELVNQVVGVFLAEVPPQLEELEAAVNDLDGNTAHIIAHTIKGEAATVGAEPLKKIALEGERYCKAGLVKKMKPIIERMRLSFEETAQEMTAQGYKPEA